MLCPARNGHRNTIKELKPEDHWSFISHLSAQDNLEIQALSMLYKLSGRNNFNAVIKMVKINLRSSFEKSPRAWATTWYKFWQHFKAFIIPIILYQFQKDPFCLIILYDILFYFIPGQEETTFVICCKFRKNLFNL